MNLSNRTINPLTTRRAYCTQGENAALPYTIDYSAYLQGDVLTSSIWTCAQNVTLTPSNTSSSATVTVQGQSGVYVIVNKIVTGAGIVDDRTLVVEIAAEESGRGYE